MKNSQYIKFWKSLFDFFISLIGIIVFFPLFLIIGLIIKFSSKGPVLFTQDRVGLEFKNFKIFKFRTMVENSQNLGSEITYAGDSRITKVGKFLRKYKLDELPQLINVISGQMSVVGPRPEVERYVKEFKGDYSHILKIKPGITDYAALKYRNEEEILKKYDNVEHGYINEVLPAKIELYRQYLDEISLMTDIKIIAKTIIRIFR